MAETIGSAARNRLIYGVYAFSCSFAGGLTASIAEIDNHNEMANRVEHCIQEPETDVVTRETQFCLDEDPFNDPTLVGSQVYQEFAIGTPFVELQSTADLYRSNDPSEAVIGGLVLGGIVGVSGAFGTIRYLRRRDKSTTNPAYSITGPSDQKQGQEAPTASFGATLYHPPSAIGDNSSEVSGASVLPKVS